MNRPHPFLLLALIPLLLAPLTACTPPAAPQEGSADIAVSAQALSTSEVAKVTLTVSAADLSPIVINLQKTGGQWRAVIGAIPVGTNRTFLAQAFNSSNDKVYEGQATGVTITSGATAAVVILLQQTTEPTPFINSAPKVTGLTASTDRVGLNESLTLAVTDSDADGDARGYTWTATGGTFANGNTASPTWTSPAIEGTYTLSVSVTDGKGGQAGISLKVAVVQARGAANVAVSFNAWPVATQVTGTPSGQVAPGGVVSLDVAAVEPDNDALTYSWADDCGGSFSGITVKSPTWTAPVSVPTSAVCTVRVTLDDGRGGSTTGQLGINLGLPQIPTMPPVIDQIFQSTDSVAFGGTVNLVVTAHDPEGEAITFTWSASAGTLGTPVTSASRSEVVWTAPAEGNSSTGNSSTITLVIQDASGQKTTQTVSINLSGGPVTCVKVVTSQLDVNPNQGAPVPFTYSIVGGGGGGGSPTGGGGGSSAILVGGSVVGFSSGGAGSASTGASAVPFSSGFTLPVGAPLKVYVGGGGGGGANWNGNYCNAGAGGAGYFGGGGGGGGGTNAAGGAASALAGSTAGTAFVGGSGGHCRYGGGTSNGGNSATGGTAAGSGGGGGGYGGGGGGGSCHPASGGGNGGSGGVNGSTGAVGSGGCNFAPGALGGLGASNWSTVTTLPAAAGSGGASNGVGGNAGLVILKYPGPVCWL